MSGSDASTVSTKRQFIDVERDERCSATNSHMIRDLICDEVANIEVCLFDGGDCCLDSKRKDTSQCQICTCKLSVNNTLLAEDFEEQNIKELETPNDFELLTSKILDRIEFHDVASKEVCSKVCLEPELNDQVNGWMFDKATKVCVCAWLMPANVKIKESQQQEFETVLSNAYIQLDKTISPSRYDNISCT